MRPGLHCAGYPGRSLGKGVHEVSQPGPKGRRFHYNFRPNSRPTYIHFPPCCILFSQAEKTNGDTAKCRLLTPRSYILFNHILLTFMVKVFVCLFVCFFKEMAGPAVFGQQPHGALRAASRTGGVYPQPEEERSHLPCCNPRQASRSPCHGASSVSLQNTVHTRPPCCWGPLVLARWIRTSSPTPGGY